MQPEVTKPFPSEYPTYVAHPSNYDEGESWALVFRGAEDGHCRDKPFFVADAKRTARILAFLAYRDWAEAFIAEFATAIVEVEEYVDSSEEVSIADFVGEPLPTACLEVHTTVRTVDQGAQDS